MTPAPDTTAPPSLHLCIATGQNLANLIPALQCGAKEVWILQTEAMRASGSHLAGALKARGIVVHREDFDDRNVQALHAEAARLAERLDGRPLTINVTGGTKPMMLALVQTLAGYLSTADEAAQPHLVYCDTQHRRLDWLAPTPRSEPMRSVLTINDILLAQGYRRVDGSGSDAAHRQRTAESRKAFTRQLGDRAQALGGFLSVVNKLATDALSPERWTPEQCLHHAPPKEGAQLLVAAQAAGLASWDGNCRIVFHDEAAAKYLSGGWVEEYAWLKLSGHGKPGTDIREWAPGLEIEHVDSGARNELDGVLVQGNRMLIVEAKAARGHDAASWIYKLSQLSRQVGGHLATAVLLSAQPLKSEDMDRAREYGVKVIAGRDLSCFADFLKEWTAG